MRGNLPPTLILPRLPQPLTTHKHPPPPRSLFFPHLQALARLLLIRGDPLVVVVDRMRCGGVPAAGGIVLHDLHVPHMQGRLVLNNLCACYAGRI